MTVGNYPLHLVRRASNLPVTSSFYLALALQAILLMLLLLVLEVEVEALQQQYIKISYQK